MNKRRLNIEDEIEFNNLQEELTGQNVMLSVNGLMSFVQPLNDFETYLYEGETQDYLCLGAEELENGFMDIPLSKIKSIISEENLLDDVDTYYINLVDNTEIILNI
jgi:hypothetical protein